MRVTVRKIGGVRALRYRYTAGECMDFDMNLLCEVGVPYQPAAIAQVKDILRDRDPGCEVQQVELPERPWYVDAIVSIAQEN